MIKKLILSFFALTILKTGSFSQALPDSDSNEHPCLLLTRAQIHQFSYSFNHNPAKLQSWNILKASADAFLKEDINIPQRGGNWEHFYISPSSQTMLTTGKLVGDWQWEHLDNSNKKVYTGDTSNSEKDYDGVVIGLIHDKWAMGALELGLTYQIVGHAKYAQKAKEILLAYANLYPRLPLQNRKTATLTGVGYGKIHRQDLNEAQWLISIVQATDLIWNVLSKQDRDSICDQLLLPAAEIIKMRKPEISNIQCWKIAAMGMVGFLTHTEKFIDAAMKSPGGGFAAHLKRGFTKDGMNIDYSPSYQFYYLHPLALLATAAKNCHYPVDLTPLNKMFEMPILMSNPYLMLPAFNDSREVNLSGFAYLYEWAYTTFKNPLFAEILSKVNRGHYKNTPSYYTGWSLLFGCDSIPVPTSRNVKNYHFKKSGIAVLSKGNRQNNLTSHIKYARQTSLRVHLQPAQLDFSVIKGDEYVSILPGNINYWSDQSNNWYRTSIAHNTLVINEQNQQNSFGECLAWGDTSGVSYIISETKNAYDSVQFIRSIAMLDENTMLIADEYYSDKKKITLADIAYHQAGVWEKKKRGRRWTPPDSAGYKSLIAPEIIKQVKTFSLNTISDKGQHYSINGAASNPCDLITAYGQPFAGKNVPALIFRQKAKHGIVAYCISASGEKIDVHLSYPANELLQLELKRENGKFNHFIIDTRSSTEGRASFNIK